MTRGRDELLVLAHTDEYPDAGIQVPAGGCAPRKTPDHWQHREQSSDQDDEMIFRLVFAPRSDHGLIPGCGCESGLDDLERLIASG